MSTIDFSRFCDWDADQVDIRNTGLEKHIVDMTKSYPPVDFLLQYNGVGCVPKGDLQAMTGKMKNGKSFACSCLEAAMLTGDFMGFEALKENIRILHVDTEQSIATIAKRAKTVHSMCDWPIDKNDERYRTISLRDCSDRLGVIVEAIERFTPDFVLIDGIRDLLGDFNDTKESFVLIDELLGLCSKYGVGIMCVLHENKANEDMRGHLGTELGNKCTEIFKVKLDKGAGIVSVDQAFCRNEPIEKWAFSIGEGGVPQQQAVSYVNATKLRRDNSFAAIFKERSFYTHTELWEAFVVEYGCKERAAKKHITDATNDNILRKRDNLYYYRAYAPLDIEVEVS